ncbi:hypothetical protein VTJ83DRAFT_1924 [Remersonia thermophila]|uniref:Proteophosphoglycan ppg4 n=1 Tax=Remersonia thermophila TaxID=72144 RepID=A0ABR4DHB3_9PEZI
MSYISNEPDASRPRCPGAAHHDAVAVAASVETSSPGRSGAVDVHLPPPDAAVALDISPSKPSSALKEASSPVPLPSFVRSFQRRTLPSASLAPSTAEGKPVPVPGTNTASGGHPSSALQNLNSQYPSAARRQGQAPTNPSSSQPAIYSQPVIVRTYSGPTPSQGSRGAHARHFKPSSGASSRPSLLSSTSAPGALSGPGRPIQPAVSSVGVGTITGSTAETSPGDSAHLANMPPPQSSSAGKAYGGSGPRLPGGLSLSLPWPFSSRQEPDEPKLPPLEAFSFKSFMDDLEAPGDNSISADLDRIAEICARSRYSLSNQYEVHVPPHGSGASFLSSPPVSSSAPSRKGHSRDRSSSLTLQVIPSDDESLPIRPGHSRRRNPAARRRSVAYSTLETIISSSRSSEEDKSKKKKSAEDLVSDVRGKAAVKEARSDPAISIPTLVRRKSASFAAVVLDTAGGSSSDKPAAPSSSYSTSSASSHRRNRQPPQPTASSSLQSLLSETARSQTPGTSSAPAPAPVARHDDDDPGMRRRINSTKRRAATFGAGTASRPILNPDWGSPVEHSSSYSSSWATWIPWPIGTGTGTTGGQSCAEGSLRQLLRDRR